MRKNLKLLLNLNFVSIDMEAAAKQYHLLCDAIEEGHSWLEAGSDLHKQKLMLGIACHRGIGGIPLRHKLREKLILKKLSA